MNIHDWRDGLELYRKRCQPGSFMRAVLENNLIGAVSRSDATSAIFIADFVIETNRLLPGFMWGSEKRVEDWLKGRVDENGDEVK